MDNGKSLINIGELAKPATTLIEKISDAIGGYFKPYQIRRVAQAEAEAEKIKALSKIDIAELTHRALGRFLAEETKKQDNIESITTMALPQLHDDSRPQDIEGDWIVNFFDKCRLVSDKEMQALWAKVLAGEANSPGNYSKRTVNFLESLDKTDANQFTSLCRFAWLIGDITPLIFIKEGSLYEKYNINFDTIKHLDDIGLLRFEGLTGFNKIVNSKKLVVFYHGIPIIIEFNNEQNNELKVGNILLSKIGQELAPICGSKALPDFVDFVITKWMSQGLILSSPYPSYIHLSTIP